MMKVPVILLNYNSSADCCKCVADLKRQDGVELEIIIVDNCSRKEDALAVEQLAADQGCTFIAAAENRGYNAGNNIGLRYAAGKGYSYALIANPDMEFPEIDYVIRLVSKMDDDDTIAVCGSNIVGIDGNRQSPRKFISYWMELFWFVHSFKKIFAKKKSDILSAENQFCEILMGSCIMVRMSFITKIGFFDEQVFLYCEEPILGKQVAKEGLKMFYLHDAKAIHSHVDSEKGSFIKRHDIYYKSRWYYLKKYAGYSDFELMPMFISKKIYYIVKRLQFIMCGVK